MARAKIREIAAGGGGIMVALAIGALGLRLTSWANDNKAQLDTTIVVSAFLAIVLFAFWYLTKNDADEGKEERVSQSSEAGGDAMNADRGGYIHKGDVVNNYPPVVAEESKKTSSPKPNLVISPPEPCFLVFNFHHWEKDAGKRGGKPGAIFQIHNKPALTGGHTGDAREVTVSLTFKERGVTLGIVSNACWLRHRENAVNIRNAEVHSVLVAIFYGPSEIQVCDNHTPMTTDIFIGRKPLPPPPKLELKRFTIQSMVEIDVVVTSKSETLAEHTFKLIRNSDNNLTIV